MLAALAGRNMSWPFALHAAMLPPKAGIKSQRSVPRVSVKMSMESFSCSIEVPAKGIRCGERETSKIRLPPAAAAL
jgi:hypothetical protein